MNNLNEVSLFWTDTPEGHRVMNDIFIKITNDDPQLKEYRDWIESNIFGFGERSFMWMWKLLIDEMPENFSFLEIGVFRGQILALIELLAQRTEKKADRTGVTPLDNTDGHWDSDYRADIIKLHKTFNLNAPYRIIKGLSTDHEIIKQAKKEYDLLYIDGGHTFDVVKSDLKNYPQMVKVGGYLIIDDCCNKYQIPNGMFAGIESVSKAVDEVFPNESFKELFSVVHNRIFKRVK